MYIAKPVICKNEGGEFLITKLNNKRRLSTKAIFALLFYLVIPLFAISIILTSYPELSKDRYIRIICWIIPTSFIIITISQISTKYEKGENKKYLLNMCYVVATLIWIYGFIGGNVIIQETWMEYEFQLHLWKYMILIIAAAAMNIFYYTVEWRYYKKQMENCNESKQDDFSKYENKITAETV